MQIGGARRQRGSGRIPRRWALLACVLLAAGCRTADNRSDSAVDGFDAPEHAWYDQGGKELSCDTSSVACKSYPDQKAFIDACVAGKFQAKTCGCQVLCSGKLSGFSAVPAAAPQGLALAAKAGSGCPSDQLGLLAKIRAARQPGDPLDRCLTSLVCNGDLGLCSAADETTAAQVRDSARKGCQEEVVTGFCSAGFQDTLSCPDAQLRSLSRAWAALHYQDSSSKRCERNVICSDSKNGCGEGYFQKGAELKQQINHDGCEYWLRRFCAMGADHW